MTRLSLDIKSRKTCEQIVDDGHGRVPVSQRCSNVRGVRVCFLEEADLVKWSEFCTLDIIVSTVKRHPGFFAHVLRIYSKVDITF